MEQNPSWESNRFSASQGITRILWTPKVHFLSCVNISLQDTILLLGVVSTSPNPQPEGPHLVDSIHIGRRSSIRNLRMRHVLVTGTRLPRTGTPPQPQYSFAGLRWTHFRFSCFYFHPLSSNCMSHLPTGFPDKNVAHSLIFPIFPKRPANLILLRYNDISTGYKLIRYWKTIYLVDNYR
jgi:hypothetical protein